MTSPRQAAAQHDMALVVHAIAGAPGVEHRGVDFWVTVARNLCAAHGCRTLAAREAPVPLPAPDPGGLTPQETAALERRLRRR